MKKKLTFKKLFPQLKKDIADFCLKEEGNIEKRKLARLGITLAIISVALEKNSSAQHQSHDSESHASFDNADHSSHTVMVGNGGHYSAMTGHSSHSNVTHTDM